MMSTMTTFKSPIGRIAVMPTAAVVAFALTACDEVETADKPPASSAAVESTTIEASATEKEAKETKTDETQEKKTTETKLSAPAIEDAPLLVGMPLHLADEKAKTVDAIDLGPEIVDGEEYQRGIIDRSNWRVVAQCDQMKNGRVKVGVVKDDEHWIIVNGGQGSLIAENALQGLLECP